MGGIKVLHRIVPLPVNTGGDGFYGHFIHFWPVQALLPSAVDLILSLDLAALCTIGDRICLFHD